MSTKKDYSTNVEIFLILLFSVLSLFIWNQVMNQCLYTAKNIKKKEEEQELDQVWILVPDLVFGLWMQNLFQVLLFPRTTQRRCRRVSSLPLLLRAILSHHRMEGFFFHHLRINSINKHDFFNFIEFSMGSVAIAMPANNSLPWKQS